MKVLIATNNAGKLREIREILENTKIEAVSLKEFGASGDPVEDADTFEGNALLKARFFAEKYGVPTIADDSGLCIDALKGQPGVYSARYSGEGATDKKNNTLVLEKLQSVPDEKRTARFCCAMACVLPSGDSLVTHGKCEGMILHEGRGENGFGYDPLFYVPEYDQTFAQIPAEKKHGISHRGRALREMASQLPEFLKTHGVE